MINFLTGETKIYSLDSVICDSVSTANNLGPLTLEYTIQHTTAHAKSFNLLCAVHIQAIRMVHLDRFDHPS